MRLEIPCRTAFSSKGCKVRPGICTSATGWGSSNDNRSPNRAFSRNRYSRASAISSATGTRSLACVVHCVAKHICQTAQVLLRRVWIVLHLRGDRVQSVEKKVGTDLRGEGRCFGPRL